jgi:hypothetical protein
VAPLDVVGGTPVLIVGTGEVVRGEMWLSNPAAADLTLTGATITVTMPTGPEAGQIPLPADVVVPGNGVRRMIVEMGMQPLTEPGAYPAVLDLATSAGSQAVPASLVVTAVTAPVILPERLVFTGVTPSAVVDGSVVVRNAGNVPLTVGPIPDEPLLEVRAHPRVLAVGAGGAMVVEPAVGLAPTGTATFTNTTPTVPPGGWSAVAFQLTAPAALASNAHLRALPRIGTERFAVDLLTV